MNSPRCHGYWLYSVATSNITGIQPERIESNTAAGKRREGKEERIKGNS
jgi:hypothetical protein